MTRQNDIKNEKSGSFIIMDSLIKKLEQAEAGSRELDERIAFIVRWRPNEKDDPRSALSFAMHESKHDYGTAWIAHRPMNPLWHIPFYTTSLDSALTLVPEGWAWFVEKIGEPFTTGSARLWIPAQWTQGLPKEQFIQDAATPALALCIAALRASVSSNIER